jgi:hypothetical protein
MWRTANQEVLGLRCEIVGLALAVGAAVFQYFSDWFPTYHRDAIALTQGSNTIDTMATLQLLSRQMNEADPQMRKQISDDIHDRTSRVIREVMDDRNQRKSVARGQQSLFSTLRLASFMLGAFLIVVGKWLVMRHKHQASLPKAAPAVPDAPPVGDAT